MKKYSLQKHHFYIFTVAILAGFLWGKYFYYGDNQNISFLRQSPLKLLVEGSALPKEVVEEFSKEADVPVEVHTYSNLEELNSALKKENYDIIWYKSFFAKELLGKNHLHKMALEELKYKDAISTDFKSPPYDKKNEYAIPVLWGVQKSTLWTENISLNQSVQNLDKAYEFINYILNPDNTKTLVNARKQATTSKYLEKTDVDPNLKPSALRKISIEKLKYE